MKPEKKSPRRAPKSVSTLPTRAVTAKRTAKKATEAGRPSASARTLAVKSKRPARATPLATKSRRTVPARPKRQPKSAPPTVAIPAILLAGDTPPPPTVSGPGQRYALGPTPFAAPLRGPAAAGELPEAYGTGRLWLTARDPQWLYAHWDLTTAQQRALNAVAAEGHLILRVFEKEILGEPLVTQPVHPESRNWFVHVGRGGTKFVAQLGYFDRKERWQTVAVSPATVTPPDRLSEDTSEEFATLAVEVPFDQLIETVKAVVSQNVPLLEALAQLRATGHPELPTAEAFAPRPTGPTKGARKPQRGAAKSAPVAADTAPVPAWTPAQASALAELVTMDEVRRVWIGSLEITELVRRQLVKQLTADAVARLTAGGDALGLGSPSSPFGALGSVPGGFGGPDQARGFWFNVNAELIIYGATEPDAKVTIGGRTIRLRPDGSFSYRFALPDGQFALPAVAISAAGDDQRAAELHFERRTAYHGEVGQHPQDPALKPPTPDQVA